jgi:shikimate kinase
MNSGDASKKEDASQPRPASLPTTHCPLPTTLFLIGYRGTGKSTVARLLAERLGWSWLDADTLLEQRQGRSIKQIFAQDGESTFRDIESALLGEICPRAGHVIATGGGIILREDNRRRLREAGMIIWLTGDPLTLWQRIQADATTNERRPHLAGGGVEEIETLLRQREPWYAECAHAVVDTVGRAPEDVVEVIVGMLGRQ